MIVTPWLCQEEWDTARDLVLNRDFSVMKYFDVWRLRVSRLPTGVETTASLVEALSSSPHTSLSLATAVNRFLNHVSHIGMNMFAVTKLHEAAEMLSVPEWIVQLRHETSHGHLPGVTMLRAALEFGLSWLDVHYWNYAPGHQVCDESQDDDTELLHRLLECYMYLKLYQVWGTERMSELARGQEEVWKHLLDLWRSVKQSEEVRLQDLSVKQAVGMVKTEICTWADKEDGVESLADILVNEDLLVPDSDFLDSLDSGEENSEEVEVPEELITIWCEFITIIDRQIGVKTLVDKLISRIHQDTSDSMAAAWVVVLVQAMLGPDHGDLHPSLTSVSPARVEVACLEAWLQHPCPLISQMCPLLCQVAGVTDSRVEMLVRLVTGDKLDNSKNVKIDTVYTEADLDKSEKNTREEVAKDQGWVLDTEHDWNSIPYGEILGSKNWSSLWINEKWSEPSKDDNNEEDEDIDDYVPKFEIIPVDWSEIVGHRGPNVDHGEPRTPHFYRDTQYSHKHEQDLFRRRKRMKKN